MNFKTTPIKRFKIINRITREPPTISPPSDAIYSKVYDLLKIQYLMLINFEELFDFTIFFCIAILSKNFFFVAR